MKKFFLSFVMLLATAVSAFASLPTTDVDLVVDENGATTFICPFDAELPAGVRAYTVTGWSDETGLILEETSILANQPCILRSESPITEMLTGVSQAEAATYTEGALTSVYAPVEITAGWVLAEIDGKWGLHEVDTDEPFTVPANQGYFVFLEGAPSDLFEGYIPDPFNPELPPEPTPTEPAKWTDSEGNEVTELTGRYFSYENFPDGYPTITLHLEGVVYGEDGNPVADGEHDLNPGAGYIVKNPDGEFAYTYIVDGGQVNQDFVFSLRPLQSHEEGGITLFNDSEIPTIWYKYFQTRRDESAELVPLWEETEWNWGGYSEFDMQLDATTTPTAGSEYVLGMLGEFEDWFYSLQVISDQPATSAGAMVAKSITFENRSAGKMTIEFSSAKGTNLPLYINVDGDKYGSDPMDWISGNIENRELGEYDLTLGSTNENDTKEITFYVNPGVHTIIGHYSVNEEFVYDDGETVYYYGIDEVDYEMSPEDYYAAQEIRVYSMHFEPIVHEVTVNSQYGWASLYHEHDLIVPEMETETETETDVTFYYAQSQSYDGTNVTLAEFTPMTQCNPYTEGKVIPANTALVFKDNNGGGTYIFYGATVGDPEELWKAGEWVAGYGLDQPEYEPTLDPEDNIFQGVIEDTPCESMVYHVMGSATTYDQAFFQPFSGTMLGAHKVYLDLNGVNGASVRLVLPGNNPIVTGVENAESKMQNAKCIMNGRLVIRKGEKMYNVNGAMLK